MAEIFITEEQHSPAPQAAYPKQALKLHVHTISARVPQTAPDNPKMPLLNQSPLPPVRRQIFFTIPGRFLLK